ncbi:MAG: TIR domain-containing protein [Syntrophaceae bacterium]
MGGGRGWSLSKDDLKKLEDIAKENLKKDSQPAKRNIFISFVQEDLKEVNLLKGQAKNEDNDLEFNDWSLREPFDSERAEYIKRGIRERIRQSSVTVVYLSDKTAKSQWVNWEISESTKLGKGVVGVFKGDGPPNKLPKAMGKNPKLVRWTHKGLANAIEQAASEK